MFTLAESIFIFIESFIQQKSQPLEWKKIKQIIEQRFLTFQLSLPRQSFIIKKVFNSFFHKNICIYQKGNGNMEVAQPNYLKFVIRIDIDIE